MRERIQNLSPRGEFFLVISVCFGYFTVSSVSILIRGIHEYRLTVPRLLWGILIEILLAGVAAWILYVRGSTIRRFGLRFSWPFLLSGIPLFLASVALLCVPLCYAPSLIPPPSRLLSPIVLRRFLNTTKERSPSGPTAESSSRNGKANSRHSAACSAPFLPINSPTRHTSAPPAPVTSPGSLPRSSAPSKTWSTPVRSTGRAAPARPPSTRLSPPGTAPPRTYASA